mgnify:CR=1 FL=1
MTAVLTLALALTSVAILALALRHGGVRLYGPQPVGTATLIAILFTSGLDVGLILFPLLDFDRYGLLFDAERTAEACVPAATSFLRQYVINNKQS